MRRGVGIVVLGLAALVAVGGCSYFGSREPALTNWEPALSPDGTRLAFESLVDKHLELFVR
ncbi:MAG: hypothetical protein PHX77_00460, partial [Candidatus Bipolaricaulis sp.]|nr:hypothetical protein [Candidatus Bipolaricaulis sp.]